MQQKKINLLTAFAIIIASLLIGFYTGRAYQPDKGRQMTGNLNPNGRMAPRAGNMDTGQGNTNAKQNGPLSGEITSLDKNSLTVKTQDGSSKIVIYSSSTKVSTVTESKISDLKTGTIITVMGQTATDGTLTALSIAVGNNTFGLPGPDNGRGR